MLRTMRVLVVGFGITGKSLSNFLYKKGFKIYVFDDKIKNMPSSDFIFIEKIEDIDMQIFEFVAVSPSFRCFYNPHSIISLAKENGIKIITDLDLLQQYYKSKYIGITGTNGKSTTVTLLYHILKENGISVYLCGNVGIPMLNIDKEYNYIILELSSYQLENAYSLDFDIGAIINIYPTHIDHHGTFKDYKKAKIRLIENSRLSFTEDNFSTLEIRKNGFSIVDRNIYKDGSLIANISDLEDQDLPFKHHPQNLCIAFIIASAIGLSTNDILSSIKTYKPLPHRTEPVRNIDNILFINDSKATNIYGAIKSIQENADSILIIGGQLLSTYDEIDQFLELKNNIKKVFLIGESADFLAKIFDQNNIDYKVSKTLDNAVYDSYNYAKSLIKDKSVSYCTILLCPMHPSFDQFANFESRGDMFKKIVLSI